MSFADSISEPSSQSGLSTLLNQHPIMRIIALDVEGTLISNGVSQFARPGLGRFLEFCRSTFDRVVVFTTLPEDRFRAVATGLIERGEAPPWFATVEYVYWHGPHKRLEFIGGCEPHQVLLLDDIEGYIAPDQRSQWVTVHPFEPPYDRGDAELKRIEAMLSEQLH